MIEYKFVVSWDEEQMMNRGAAAGNANSFRITRESASANIMQMLVGEESEDDVMMVNQEGKSKPPKIGERPT